jgi:hypothetical protein
VSPSFLCVFEMELGAAFHSTDSIFFSTECCPAAKMFSHQFQQKSSAEPISIFCTQRLPSPSKWAASARPIL